MPGGLQPKAGEAPFLFTNFHNLKASSIDLDGDGIEDQIRRESQGLQESISVTLSRSGEFPVLRFAPSTSEQTLLSVQDLDGDGDVDFLWSDPLRLVVSVVCFNNGSGHFECLPPPVPQIATHAPYGASLKQFHLLCFESLFNSEHSSSSEHKSSSQRSTPLVPVSLKLPQESQLGSVSSVFSLPTDRGPPAAMS